jgi:hypothetical protein
MQRSLRRVRRNGGVCPGVTVISRVTIERNCGIFARRRRSLEKMRCVARRYREALALAAVILAQLLVACGGGSSGSGGQSPPPPSNPVPAIVSLSPNSANAGGVAFTVTITGYDFISSSSVQWNGSARTTTYTSGTQLQVQITASDIASSGSATLSVTNPTPGGGNPLPWTGRGQ